MMWIFVNMVKPSVIKILFNFIKSAPSIHASLQKILPLFDQIVASTDYLAKAFREDFNLPNVTVIKNVVPSFLWGTDIKAPLTSDLVKPHIGYTGAPQHYRNPIPLGVLPEYPLGVTAMTGDWTNEWVNFIKAYEKNNKDNRQIYNQEIEEKQMETRPELSRKLDGQTFQSYYYLKKELVDFCRKNGLPVPVNGIDKSDK